MSDKLKVFAVQMTSTDDVGANLEQMLQSLNSIQTRLADKATAHEMAKEKGSAGGLVDVQSKGAATLVSFPENCLFLRLNPKDSPKVFSLDSPELLQLAKRAKALNVHLHIGSLPLQREGQSRLSNATIWISAQGQVQWVYEKLHLFDIELEDGTSHRESEVFLHGSAPSVVALEGWKLGLSICYDLRFSYLYDFYAAQECDLVLVPSAFLVQTGRAHWEVLLRARAIESQAFVVAAAQCGKHGGLNGGFRETYGHSLIVDPWGKKLCEGAASTAELLEFELSRDMVKRVRRQIPMKSHRRDSLVRESKLLRFNF